MDREEEQRIWQEICEMGVDKIRELLDTPQRPLSAEDREIAAKWLLQEGEQRQAERAIAELNALDKAFITLIKRTRQDAAAPGVPAPHGKSGLGGTRPDGRGSSR